MQLPDGFKERVETELPQMINILFAVAHDVDAPMYDRLRAIDTLLQLALWHAPLDPA